MPSHSSSTTSTQQSSSSTVSHLPDAKSTNIVRYGLTALFALCAVLMLVAVFAWGNARSWRLVAQATEFAMGRKADVSSLGPFAQAVPIPTGWDLMGVSRAESVRPSAVVGLVATGSVKDIAKTYVYAMEAHGWTLSHASQDVGIITFRRQSAPRLASVMFRPTGSRSVTVVVQVEQ